MSNAANPLSTTPSAVDPTAVVPTAGAPNAVDPLAGESVTPVEDASLVMTKAFERVKAKASALPVNALLEIRVSVGDMVQTIVGALSQLHAHRADLERAGDCDMAHLDNLEDFVYALAYVYSRVREASGKPSIKTIEQLVQDRQLLNAHATAFALSGLFDKDKVARINRGKSYQDVAYDVVGLTNLFLDNWSKLQSSTVLKRPQLVEIQAAATTLIRTLGERELKPGERAELNLLYRQVYTLTYIAYNELREALTYARRREKDVASIAPSLHEDQGRRKPGAEIAPAPDGVDDGEEEVAAISARATALSPLAAQQPPEGAPRTSLVAPAGSQGAVRAGFPGAPSVLNDSGER